MSKPQRIGVRTCIDCFCTENKLFTTCKIGGRGSKQSASERDLVNGPQVILCADFIAVSHCSHATNIKYTIKLPEHANSIT